MKTIPLPKIIPTTPTTIPTNLYSTQYSTWHSQAWNLREDRMDGLYDFGRWHYPHELKGLRGFWSLAWEKIVDFGRFDPPESGKSDLPSWAIKCIFGAVLFTAMVAYLYMYGMVAGFILCGILTLTVGGIYLTVIHGMWASGDYDRPGYEIFWSAEAKRENSPFKKHPD